MVFGWFDPLNGEVYQQNPRKANPCIERHHIDRQNRSTGVTCARDRDQKKTKKETLQWQTGYSPRPPMSSDRNTVRHGGWSSGNSYVSSFVNVIERLPSCEGSKSGWSHYLGQWLIQQLYSHVRPWCSSILLELVEFNVDVCLLLLCSEVRYTVLHFQVMQIIYKVCRIWTLQHWQHLLLTVQVSTNYD